MGRIRTIKPEFFTHEELSTLDAETHLFAAGLLCYADDAGYFNANEGLVKAAIFPLRDSSVSVHDMLKQLVTARYVRLGRGNDGKHWGQVINFDTHQRVNRPTPSRIKEMGIKWEDSMKTHPQLTEDSLPEGKGREQGKEGKTEEPPPPPVDFSKDHEPDIPEGLAIVQYAGFVCEKAHIPASYGLKVKVGDAIRMLAQMESCSEARATALMVPRTMEAQKQGAKIHLWLDDGGWKTKTEVPGGSNQNVTRQRVDKGVGAVAEYLAKRGVSAVGNPGSADGAAIPVAGVGTVAGGIPVGLRTASGEVFAAASGASTSRVAHPSRPEILPKA